MLRNIATYFLSALLLASLLMVPERFVLAQTCPAHKIIIPFINGVFVTKIGAYKDIKFLKSAICANPSDTTACQNGDFELLYNSSGLNNLPSDKGTLTSMVDAIKGAWQDVVETLWQIANENGRPAPAWYDYLLYIFMNPGNQSVVNLNAADLMYEAAHPPTRADTAAMSTALDDWYNAGDDILLTAHSQGNLFAYPAYNTFTAGHSAQFIAAYDIAPPTSLLPGQYTLNSLDLVIKLASVADGVLNPSIEPPTPNTSEFCSDDWSGHSLTCYLEGQQGTGITSDIGTLYLQLENNGYPSLQPPIVLTRYYNASLISADAITGSVAGCANPGSETTLAAAENDAESWTACYASVIHSSEGNFDGPWTPSTTADLFYNQTQAVFSIFRQYGSMNTMHGSMRVQATYTCGQMYTPPYGSILINTDGTVPYPPSCIVRTYCK